jgi:hypothetical protein
MNRRQLLLGTLATAICAPRLAPAQTFVRPGKSFRAYPSNAMIDLNNGWPPYVRNKQLPCDVISGSDAWDTTGCFVPFQYPNSGTGGWRAPQARGIIALQANILWLTPPDGAFVNLWFMNGLTADPEDTSCELGGEDLTVHQDDNGISGNVSVSYSRLVMFNPGDMLYAVPGCQIAPYGLLTGSVSGRYATVNYFSGEVLEIF